jgi:predicted transcriptional regulator
MKDSKAEAPKSTTLTVRISPQLNRKLGTLARTTSRSKSYLAGEAIASFVDVNAWQVAEIKRGLAEARSGTPGVPHAEVERWVRSWDTGHELPRPTAKKP